MVNQVSVAEEDRQRAQCYRLLSHLLAGAPQAEALALVAKLDGDDSTLGQAIDALAATARETSPEQADDEFHELFIGVGRGELVAHGSFYITGFLNEKPLARLRQDMARLGIERTEDTAEPEDSIASVCEIMAGLIEGSFGAPAALAEQADFFDKHVAPWAPHFFADLEKAKTASFYRPVGTVGRLFMNIETTAFEMAA
jgi:TorA maturation chaperone TorD